MTQMDNRSTVVTSLRWTSEQGLLHMTITHTSGPARGKVRSPDVLHASQTHCVLGLLPAGCVEKEASLTGILRLNQVGFLLKESVSCYLQN